MSSPGSPPGSPGYAYRPVPYPPYAGPPPPAPSARRWIPLAIAGVFVVFALGLLLVVYSGTFTGRAPGLGLGLFGAFFVLIILFFVVRVAFWGTRTAYRRGSTRGYNAPDPALRIARRRYARGEITREQYDQMVQDLRR